MPPTDQQPNTNAQANAAQVMSAAPSVASPVPAAPVTPVYGGDATAVPQPPTPTPTPSPSPEELKKQAMLAMEGEEGRRQRELEEQRKKEAELRAKLEGEKTQLELKLRELLQQKEALELEWIKYNNQETPLETQVQPIIAEEKAAEDEERKVEQDEAVAVSTPGTPVAKIQEVEIKRWTVQERRHHAEEQKWAFQKQIESLKAAKDELGNAYRKILSDEDALKKTIRDAETALANLSIPKAA